MLSIVKILTTKRQIPWISYILFISIEKTKVYFMRTFISYLLIALFSFGLLVNEASAKRFGAGRSFGIQRSQNALFSQNKVQKSSVMGQSTKNPSRWGAYSVVY